MDRFVFVRCAWMKRYAGDAEDRASGGGSYIKKHLGGERYNFKVVKGRVYGRFQSNRADGGFKFEGIDPSSGSGESLTGVLIVFVAKPPGGGQRVVGWYKNGTVRRQERPAGARQRSDVEWNMSASAKDALLLPLVERTWLVPAGKGGMSTSHVRYPFADSGKSDVRAWMRSILKKISAYKGPNAVNAADGDDGMLADVEKALAKGGRAGFLADAAARRAVELRAMDAATAYFGGPEKVTDDSRGNPYDLSVLVDGKKKYVEVKGTTGGGAEVLLTAGEVRWAGKNQMALFVLRDVKLKKSGSKWVASGGTPFVVDPWKPAAKALSPIASRYQVPSK